MYVLYKGPDFNVFEGGWQEVEGIFDVPFFLREKIIVLGIFFQLSFCNGQGGQFNDNWQQGKLEDSIVVLVCFLCTTLVHNTSLID